MFLEYFIDRKQKYLNTRTHIPIIVALRYVALKYIDGVTINETQQQKNNHYNM